MIWVYIETDFLLCNTYMCTMSDLMTFNLSDKYLNERIHEVSKWLLASSKIVLILMQVSLQHCSYAKAHCMHAHTIQQSYVWNMIS